MKNKLASINIFSWEFIWLLFCGFMTIVWMSEVWDVKTAPDKYACLWGGEGPVLDCGTMPQNVFTCFTLSA